MITHNGFLKTMVILGQGRVGFAARLNQDNIARIDFAALARPLEIGRQPKEIPGIPHESVQLSIVIENLPAALALRQAVNDVVKMLRKAEKKPGGRRKRKCDPPTVT